MIGTLSEPELIELTGKRHRCKQARELEAMGIRHCIRENGSIVVARAHVDIVLGLVPSSTPAREPEIQF